MSSNMERMEFDLPENHGWVAKPGNRIFVANKGAMRFEVPQDWTMNMPKGSRAFVFYDRETEAAADIRLDARVIYLAQQAPNVDWSQLQPWNEPPITEWLKKNIASDRRNPIKVSPPLTLEMNGIKVAWAETDFVDPLEQRLAHTRLCYALKAPAALMGLIAMDYWHDVADRARSAWNDVLGTLKLGEYVESPFRGPDR